MGLFEDWERESRFSTASGMDLPYVVMQVTLKEKLLGTGSGNLEDLEDVINDQFSKGYRLLSMSTSSVDSKGFAGGERIQATLVFEKLHLESLYYQLLEKRNKSNSSDDLYTLASKLTKEEEKQNMDNISSDNAVRQNTVPEGENKIMCQKIDSETIKCCNCGTKQSIYRLKLGCKECGIKFI